MVGLRIREHLAMSQLSAARVLPVETLETVDRSDNLDQFEAELEELRLSVARRRAKLGELQDMIDDSILLLRR
jgi:septal ring factor EnvC (AmiA/AmiB activator)